MKLMNKVLQGERYVANFIDAPVRVGSIFRMDHDQFIPALHFNDAYPDIDMAKWTDSGTKGILKFSESKQVTISFGGGATSGIGKTEVKLKFTRSKSVAGAIQDASVSSIRYDNILAQLKQIWSDKGYVNFLEDYIFVFEVVTAASGTLIYSEEANNEVVLKHTLDNAVTKVVDLASGNFEYVSNTKRTLEIIRNVAHKPLFRAFTFRKNWQPRILGA